MKKLAIPFTVLLPAGAVLLLTHSEAAALVVFIISVLYWAVRLIRSCLKLTSGLLGSGHPDDDLPPDDRIFR